MAHSFVLFLAASAARFVGYVLVSYWLRERAWNTIVQRHGLSRAIPADPLLGRIIESPLVTGGYEGCSAEDSAPSSPGRPRA